MNLQFLISIDMCREAIEKLNSRREQAAEKLQQLDAGHNDRLTAYIQNQLSDAELDEVLLERARLVALTQETHSTLTEAILKRRDELLRQATNKRNALEQYQRRVRFAEIYNGILTGTKGFNLDQVKQLEEIRPGSIPGDAWWRFTAHRTEYGCLPENSRPAYGEFCKVALYQPEPLED